MYNGEHTMSDNTLFWNVDTQYDFMRDTYEVEGETREGKLPVPGADRIEDELAALTEYAQDHGVTVVNTADWHNEDSDEISYDPEEIENDDEKFPEHCMQGTPGARYVPATEPDDAYRIDWQDDSVDLGRVQSERELVLYKDVFNVFAGSPHTDTVVDALDPDRAVVYGVATDVCVNQAVNGLLDRGIEVYVAEDATAGMGDVEQLDAVKQAWEDRGAVLFQTEELFYSHEDALEHVGSGHGLEGVETLYATGAENDAWLDDLAQHGYIPGGYALKLQIEH